MLAFCWHELIKFSVPDCQSLCIVIAVEYTPKLIFVFWIIINLRDQSLCVFHQMFCCFMFWWNRDNIYQTVSWTKVFEIVCPCVFDWQILYFITIFFSKSFSHLSLKNHLTDKIGLVSLQWLELTNHYLPALHIY